MRLPGSQDDSVVLSQAKQYHILSYFTAPSLLSSKFRSNIEMHYIKQGVERCVRRLGMFVSFTLLLIRAETRPAVLRLVLMSAATCCSFFAHSFMTFV